VADEPVARRFGRAVSGRVRPVAGRVRRRLLAARAKAPETSVVIVAPTQAAQPPQERARPLPDGWTEDELRSVMGTISLDGGPPGELNAYLDDAYWRFLQTWGLVRDAKGRALELGANPYFITWLLREFTSLDVSLANYFGDANSSLAQRFSIASRDGTTTEAVFESQLFNMEQDRFPYDDDSFDVVLFCEIVEHLLVDPLHAIREIRRVLRPGGLLVVTTPNVARLGNVLALVAGENVYDPYSGYGAYGRHNREYTQHELVKLLTFCGFEVDIAFTANAHPEAYESRFAFDKAMPLIDFRKNDLGQYLFASGRKAGVARDGLPGWLYRSVPADQLVDD